MANLSVRFLSSALLQSYVRTLVRSTTPLIKKSSRSVYSVASDYKIIQEDSGTNLKRYNVGLFGVGRIARNVHLQNILSNHRLSLQWLVDDSEESVTLVKEGNYYIPTTKFFRTDDIDILLQDPSLDAVIVTSPTQTHMDLICRSLRAGKAVLTEKPCAETYDEIKLCFETAEREKKPLITAFQRRFDSCCLDVKSILDQGSLGDIKLMRLTSRDSPKPSYEFLKNTDAGGCSAISDMAVHDIDSTVWFTSGEVPSSVYAITHAHDATMKEIGQPDIAVLVLKYEGGLISMIDIDRDSAYGYDIRIEIFGSEGMTNIATKRETTAITEYTNGANMRRLVNSFPERFEKAYVEELRHLVDCLDGKATPAVTKEECLLTQRIVDKGVESFLTGQVAKF